MERIGLVAANTFRGILYARSLYLWIIAVLVVGIQLAPQIIFRNNPPNVVNLGRRPAPQGMTEEQQKQYQASFDRARREQFLRNRPLVLASGMRTWSFLAILFGILLGANAMANEVAAKTIITVLARPITRWELLFGKWLAIQAFGVLSLLAGVAIHFAAGWYLSVSFSSIFWLALLQSLVSIMLYSALAMALAMLSGPMVAAGIAAVIFVVPDFVTFLKGDPTRWVHVLGSVLDWIVPPGFQSFFAQSVDATLALDYSAMSKVLLENLLYGGIFFLLACLIFSRREVRLG